MQQFEKYTGEPYAGASDDGGRKSYLGLLNGLFPSEKAYSSPMRQLIAYSLAYGLGGKNDTSLSDFMVFLGKKGISDTWTDFINRLPGAGGVSHTKELYDSIEQM